MKNRNIHRFIPILFIICIVALGIWLWRSYHHETSKKDLILYGNIDIRTIDLAFNASERIEQVLAEEGDRVEKGALLATLEMSRLSHEALYAEARMLSQRATVSRLEAGSRPEEIRKARADVEALEAEYRNADINYRRLNALAEQGTVTIKQRDDAKASADSAAARLQAAREVLELALIGPRKEDIAAAKSTLKAYQEEMSVAKRRLEYAYLYAPSEGIIQNRIMEPGDMASPQKPVFTLALTNPVWVRAYIPQPDLGKVKLGMTAGVSTDSYPGKTYKGWVGFISPTAEFTPKSVETTEIRTKLVYQIRIYVCNPQNELHLGMPATVKIALNQSTGETAPDQDRCKNP
jgi:membrane fusion protein YbhG